MRVKKNKINRKKIIFFNSFNTFWYGKFQQMYNQIKLKLKKRDSTNEHIRIKEKNQNQKIKSSWKAN